MTVTKNPSAWWRLGAALAIALPALVHANQDVEKNIADPKNWAVQAGDEFNQRYTKLNQINVSNVGKMQVAWTFSTGVLRGHEGSPLVIGDMMYIHSPFPNKVFAMDLNTQKILWKYEPKQDPAVIPQMCCDTVNRGLAYAENKVFLQQADSTLVALDAKTGAEVWHTTFEDYTHGYYMSLAPLVIDGRVLVGVSGGELGIRGFIAAFDVDTGKELWRTYTVPKPGEPGSETWPNGDQWKTGGGSVWMTGVYDPDTKLTFWGTGNGGPWMGDQRPGDNLYT